MSYTITKGIKRVDGCEDFELCGVDSIGCAANVSVSFNDNDEILKVKAVNPPKAKSKKWTPDFYELGELPKHFDCVCNKCGGKCCTGQCSKQELSGWPESGDKCIANDEVCTFLCKSPFGDEAVIARDSSVHWDVISVPYSDLQKPKTPEEELRDDIVQTIHDDVYQGAYEKQYLEVFANALMSKYNIAKKVCY